MPPASESCVPDFGSRPRTDRSPASCRFTPPSPHGGLQLRTPEELTMAAPKDYSSFAELERDLVRPEMRIGWSVDEIESTGETLEFDMDPFEAAMWEAEQEDEDDE